MITTSLYFLQEKIIFLPTVLEQDFQYQFKHHFEEINLEANDGTKLNALHFKIENPKGIILYFHGNAGDLSRWGQIAEFFVDKHYDVLIMDYRTYGKSTGKLSEEAFYSDASMFYDYLKNGYNENDIILYGRSLGTAIASYLASKNKPKQLILETPYYSMVDVGKLRFPIFPVEQLMKYKFPTYQFVKEVNCEITMFHGTNDSVVPYESAKKLFEVAHKPQTTFITIAGGRHNDLVNFNEYQLKIDLLLK
ncbi:alpha/beta fold hydrolase [Litoribaculum gwangyangense]|uniref:Alpha/beta fold hydrolase n=2 Tax=Litoribaculum gwangyangense TaxID=1130722 RepID=A0ABP9CL75_9FLAO